MDRMRRRYGLRGFSLIELLTALVIVAILASIAIPTYTSQVRRSRRTEARTALLDVASREERLFSTTTAYSNTPSDIGYGASGSTFPLAIGSGYYNVSVTVVAGPPAGFTVTATPVTGKGQDKDTQCASFSVDEAGRQTSKDSSSNDSTSTCWG
jgi:type IV pilus assembly protein PilE